MRFSEELWKTAKRDYVKNSISYEGIAEKYGISRRAVANRAQKENWQALKHKSRKIVEKAVKTAESECIERAKQSALNLFDLADQMTNAISTMMAAHMDELRPADLKALTAAMKDIKDIKGIKSDADAREQEARIKKLVHDCEDRAVDAANNYGVFLMPPQREGDST